MRRNFFNCTPSVEDVAVPSSFVRSVRKTVKRSTTDGKGAVIGEELVSIPVIEVIPHEEFENVGLSADLFTVENQLEAGIDLFKAKPITTPLFGMTLDNRSEAMEKLESFDFDSLLEKSVPNPSAPTINFDADK